MFFRPKKFSDPNFFLTKIFCSSPYLDQKYFFPKIFCNPKFYLDPKLFQSSWAKILLKKNSFDLSLISLPVTSKQLWIDLSAWNSVCVFLFQLVHVLSLLSLLRVCQVEVHNLLEKPSNKNPEKDQIFTELRKRSSIQTYS